MPEAQNPEICVSGSPAEVRAFAEHVLRERPGLRVDFVKDEADPDQLGYGALTGVVVSVVGGLGARLAYDLLIWAYTTAIARKLKATEPPSPPK